MQAKDPYEKAARNQSLFREVNERIEELSELSPDDAMDVICECWDVGCSETIKLARTEYEAIRGRSNSFAVKPGHEDSDVEKVVYRHDEEYVVVEKLHTGEAVAKALDPRH